MSVGKYSPVEQIIAWSITSFDADIYAKGGYVHVRNDPSTMSANVLAMFFNHLKIDIGDMVYYSSGKPQVMKRDRFDELFNLTGSVSSIKAEELIARKREIPLVLR